MDVECLVKLGCAGEPLEGKALLEVKKLGAADRKKLAEWVEIGHLQQQKQGQKTLYSIGQAGREWLEQQHPERWQEVIKAMAESQTQLRGILKRLYLEGVPMSGKLLFGVPQIDARHKKLVAAWVEAGYVVEQTTGNKKLYALGDAGVQLIKEDSQSWEKLQEERRRKVLETVRDRGTAKGGDEIHNCLDQGLIEEVEKDSYRLTEPGSMWLFSHRSPEVIIEDLRQLLDAVVGKAKDAGPALLKPSLEEAADEEFAAFAKQQLAAIEGHLQASLKELESLRERVATIMIASGAKKEIAAAIEATKKSFTSQVEKITGEFFARHKEFQESRRQAVHAVQERMAHIEGEYRKLSEKIEGLMRLHQSGKSSPAAAHGDDRPRGGDQVQAAGKKPTVAPAETLTMAELLYQTYQTYCREHPLVQGIVSVENLYHKAQETGDISVEHLHQALLELEKKNLLHLATDEGYPPLTDLTPAIRSRRGLLCYVEPPQKLDVKEMVYQIAKTMVYHEHVVPLPRLFSRVQEQVAISPGQFEDAIRALARKLRLDRAQSTDDQGGVFIEGVYYFFVIGVE